jgi:hypothetical protein
MTIPAVLASECTQFGGGVYFSRSELSNIEDCHYRLIRVHFFRIALNMAVMYSYYYSD